jgi:hypothetical protein
MIWSSTTRSGSSTHELSTVAASIGAATATQAKLASDPIVFEADLRDRMRWLQCVVGRAQLPETVKQRTVMQWDKIEVIAGQVCIYIYISILYSSDM